MKTLTSVSKENAFNDSMVFWDQIFWEVGQEYPDAQTNTLLVGAASMFTVKDPKRFEIVVTSNLFGDTLTDLGAIEAALVEGKTLTPDVGGSASTSAVGDGIVRHLSHIVLERRGR